LPAVTLFGVATGGLHPVIGLRLAGLGQGEIVVGAVAAAFYSGAFAGALGCRYLVGVLGYRRSFAVAAGVACLATAALALADLWWVWLVLRLLAGGALGAYYVIVESCIIHATRPTERSINLAAYETVRLAAIASGPLVLSLAAIVSDFLGAALAMLVAGLSLAFVREEPSMGPDADPARASLSGVISRAPAALAACLAAGTYAGSFYGLGALFASNLGWPNASVPAFMTAVLLAPVVTQVPVGSLADRFGRRFLILATTGMAVVVGALLSFGFGGPFTMVALAALFGGACYPLYSLGVGLMGESVEAREVVAADGLANVAYNIGAIGGPLAAAATMALVGPPGLYVFLSGTVLLVPALLLLTSRAACLRPGCCAASA
jgi:MFS family permease